MGMSWMEIGLFILVVVVAFGGSNQLPELARSVGEAIGEFKRAMNSDISVDSPEEHDEISEDSSDESDHSPPPD